MARAQLAQVLQESIARRNAVHVAGNGFDDHAGDAIAFTREQSLRSGDIVVRQRKSEVGQHFRYAGRGRHTECERARTGFDQKRVAVAVVAALEFHDGVAAGEAACNADRGHRRLGAGVDHAQHLHRRHQARDFFGHAHFRGAGRAVGQSGARRLLHGFAHLGMVVADDHRPPRTDVVDVAFAFDIPQAGAVGVVGEERLAADGFECAHRRVDAAGKELLRALEQVVVRGHVYIFTCGIGLRNAGQRIRRQRRRTRRKLPQ